MTLRTQLIKLAHENPDLREDLLPILKQGGLMDRRPTDFWFVKLKVHHRDNPARWDWDRLLDVSEKDGESVEVFDVKKLRGGERQAGTTNGKLKQGASWFDMFFKEKRIPSKVFDVTDQQGVTHSIPNEVVIEAIKQTRGSEKKKIEETLRMIDFKNGDVNHYLAHLAKGLAESYSGALRFAKSTQF